MLWYRPHCCDGRTKNSPMVNIQIAAMRHINGRGLDFRNNPLDGSDDIKQRNGITPVFRKPREPGGLRAQDICRHGAGNASSSIHARAVAKQNQCFDAIAGISM